MAQSENRRREYMQEYYQRNKERKLAEAKRRYEHDKENSGAAYIGLDKMIRRILGHDPEWWEREYFLN